MDRREVVAVRKFPLFSNTKKNNVRIRCARQTLFVVSMMLSWLAPATTKVGGSNGSRSAFAFVAGFSPSVGGRPQVRSFGENRSDGLFRRRPLAGSVRIRSPSVAATTFEQQSPFPHRRQFSSRSILNARTDGSNDDGDIPLVFLHGMKGSHLAFSTESGETQRSWLSLGGLLNFPRREDGHPERDFPLPLSYTSSDEASFAVQDRGRHFVDGTVDHVVELSGMLPANVGEALLPNTGNLDFFPFYGQATKFLEEVNDAYVKGGDSTSGNSKSNSNNSNTGESPDSGSNNERTVESIMKPRPTRSFVYDWRRNLFELAEEFHAFCEKEFPNGQPVQVVAHSMGGLIAYAAMKEHPSKYGPGGVLVGVPFGTGIQYLQDMHKGYFSELGTCRQFLPPAQFTFSSHWSFFPMTQDEIGDSLVDVSKSFEAVETNGSGGEAKSVVAFEADRSTIGKTTPGNDSADEKWRPATPGAPIEIDFYDPDEWEKNEIGIFDPSYRHLIDAADGDQISEYKKHMELQMKDAKRWRTTVLAPWKDEGTAKKHMPPLTVCSTVTVPTSNQILRRKRLAAPSDSSTDAKNKVYEYFPRSLISLVEKASGEKERPVPSCQWEYDYASGRSVPGDGRIDYDKSFPPAGTSYSTVDLDSLHAKQFCWEETGGDLGTVWEQVNRQLEDYQETKRESDRLPDLQTTR